MLLWINGTFGVGKTTTAERVRGETGWRLFDPEHVGYLIGGNLRDLGYDDFQDLPPWRTLVPVVAGELARFTETPVLVAVQSVLVEDYWRELVTGLAAQELPVHHVVLDAEEAELRRRIEHDEVEAQARDWRLDHLAALDRARPWLARSADLMLDTTGMTPDEVAGRVIESTSAALAGDDPSPSP